MLAALVAAWEEVKAAQEAAAKLEGELFRTKARATTILSEEVRPLYSAAPHFGAPFQVV